MLLPTDAARSGRPVTFGEVLGVKEGEALMLNTAEAAVCHRCGAEPRLHTHASPKGREVVIWIPVDHICKGRAQ